MGDSMSPPLDPLNQILERLKEEGPYVLASPEDADFFRKQKQPVKNQEIKKEPVAPAVIPKPAPVKEVMPSEPLPREAPTSAFRIPTSEFPSKPSHDLASVRNVLSVVAPELAIINEIPNDAIAKKIAERWKTKNQSAPISILLFQEPAEQRALLEQIAKAIDVCFGPAKIVNAETIEKEKQWEAFLSVSDLKMVIVCDYTLWQLNGLMQFYKETPAQGTRMLGNIPLFLLPDLSLYLKDPLLKRSLWKALCQKFS